MKAVRAEDLEVGKTVYLTGGKKIRGTKVEGTGKPAAPSAPPKSDNRKPDKSSDSGDGSKVK